MVQYGIMSIDRGVILGYIEKGILEWGIIDVQRDEIIFG